MSDTARTLVSYVDAGEDDGAIFGRDGAKISFYGGTPIVQPAIANQAYLCAVVQGATSVGYGFSTASSVSNLIVLVNAMRSALVELNIMKGSA